jgi:hypothetical protein
MSGVKDAVGRIAHSEKAVHLAWLLVLLLSNATGIVAANSGSSGP